MVRVKQWFQTINQALPTPILEDDSELYPPELVKNIREWLKAEAPRYKAANKPADQVIAQGSASFTLPGTLIPTPAEMGRAGANKLWEFESGTAEILCRDVKSRIILARYSYMSARERNTQNVIVGEQLWVIQEGRVN